MDINTIKYGTLESILLDLARRIKQRRLELNLTQKKFAKRIGIGYDAYRNLEMTGDTSLKNIVLIAFILDDVATINQLFTQRNYQSIEEIVREKQIKTRARASKNK
jgi:transcriptional regulator with XRE-family HTH domain